LLPLSFNLSFDQIPTDRISLDFKFIDNLFIIFSSTADNKVQLHTGGYNKNKRTAAEPFHVRVGLSHGPLYVRLTLDNTYALVLGYQYMVMSDDDYTVEQHDLLQMMSEYLISTEADAVAPLRCDYGHCERSKGESIILVFQLFIFYMHSLHGVVDVSRFAEGGSDEAMETQTCQTTYAFLIPV